MMTMTEKNNQLEYYCYYPWPIDNYTDDACMSFILRVLHLQGRNDDQDKKLRIFCFVHHQPPPPPNAPR